MSNYVMGRQVSYDLSGKGGSHTRYGNDSYSIAAMNLQLPQKSYVRNNDLNISYTKIPIFAEPQSTNPNINVKTYFTASPLERVKQPSQPLFANNHKPLIDLMYNHR